MPNQDTETFREIRQLLDRVLPLASSTRALAGEGEPQAGSAAAAVAGVESCRLAWEHACTCCAVAADHLFTWGKAHVEGGTQPWYAHLTLLRTALETAVIARWLLDGEISPEERLARAIGVQLHDQRERDKWERSFPPDVRPRRHAGRAWSGAGRVEIWTRLKSRWHLPNREIIVTDLCDEYAETAGEIRGSSLYRQLGAASHGRTWAALPMSKIEGSRPRTRGLSVEVTADDTLAVFATRVALVTAEFAVAELASYSTRPGGPRVGGATEAG